MGSVPTVSLWVPCPQWVTKAILEWMCLHCSGGALEAIRKADILVFCLVSQVSCCIASQECVTKTICYLECFGVMIPAE